MAKVRAPVSPVTLPDVFTAHLTTGIPNIEGYFEASLGARTATAFAMGFAATLSATRQRTILDFGLSGWPQRPSGDRARRGQTSDRGGGGGSLASLPSPPNDYDDAYSFTSGAAIARYCNELFAATSLPDFKLLGGCTAQALRCPYRELIATISTHSAAELQPRAMRTMQSRKSPLFATSSPRSPRQPHSKPPKCSCREL